MKAERVYSHSPRGMVVMTGEVCLSYKIVVTYSRTFCSFSLGRYTKVPIPWSDNAIWMMGNPNWASIQLHLGEVRHEFGL